MSVAALLGLAVVHARPSTRQPTFRAGIALVEVTAVVTADDGRPITDLQAGDFEIHEDGEPRTLVSVRRLAPGISGPATTPLPPPAGAREATPTTTERLARSSASADAPAFVILLDDLDTSRRDAFRVIRAGEEAFRSIPGSALVSVVTTSGLGGSLVTLEPPGAAHLERIRDFRGQLLVRATTPGGLGGGGGGGAGGRAPFSDGLSDGYNLDTLDPTRAARRASAVAAACEILGRAGSRRKVLVWVAQTMGVSVEDPHGSRAAQRRALAAALANDVTVYILDPRGNTGGAEDPDSRRTGGALRVGGSSMALEVDDMVAVPLTQITRETGGRYVTMANNLGEILADTITLNASSYLLAYESPVSTTPGRHRIEVRVRRPAARVSARRGYLVESPTDTTTAPVDVENLLLRRTLMGSAPTGTIDLVVHAAPRPAVGREGSVVVSVAVTERTDARPVPIDVLLATFDDQGRQTQQHHVRLDAAPAGQPMEFATELPLARGHHQLRVAAATVDQSRAGLAMASVEIARPGRDLEIHAPVLLRETAGRVAPTARRRFGKGTPVGVQVDLAGRSLRAGGAVVRVGLADAAGAVLGWTSAVIDAGPTDEQRRATALIGTSGLLVGDYTLIVEATSGGRTRPMRHLIPVRIDDAPPAG